jgi:hypothetical protein
VGEEELVSPAFLGVEAGVEAGVGVGVPFPRVLAMISSILCSKSSPQSRFFVQQFIFVINFVVYFSEKLPYLVIDYTSGISGKINRSVVDTGGAP